MPKKKPIPMQPRFCPPQTVSPGRASSSRSTPSRSEKAEISAADLTRIFNAALLSSRSSKKRDFSSELFELTESPAFKTMLNAIRQLARVQCIHEREAAEQMIEAFRKLDELWGEYMFCEGLDRIRNPRS